MHGNSLVCQYKELAAVPKKMPARFTNEEAARTHLEKLQWPNGTICPHCQTLERASRIEGGRKGLWFCNACRKQFSVTVGTVFERSKIPLHTWLYANHLIYTSKKGISSHQLSRMLGVTYKTAWFMTHRIREAMAPAADTEPMGGEGKTVEADEMYVGKKAGRRKHPGSGGYAHKRTVVSLVERGGKSRSVHIDAPARYEIMAVLRDNTKAGTHIMTDGSQIYRLLPVKLHDSINHASGEYSRTKQDGTKVHTNTVEGFFGIFKRGMIGTYQHCGQAHLQRYLAEFDFRYSNRAALGIDDAVRADLALKGIIGKRLTYRRTVQA
jgi:transposase-like protein